MSVRMCRCTPVSACNHDKAQENWYTTLPTALLPTHLHMVCAKEGCGDAAAHGRQGFVVVCGWLVGAIRIMPVTLGETDETPQMSQKKQGANGQGLVWGVASHGLASSKGLTMQVTLIQHLMMMSCASGPI